MSATLCNENLPSCALKSLPGALKSLPGALEIVAWSVVVSFCQQTRRHQVDFSGHRVNFSEHQVNFSGHKVLSSTRFWVHKVADSWTHGAKYYEHFYACSRSMGGPCKATKVLLILSKQGPSTIKKTLLNSTTLPPTVLYCYVLHCPTQCCTTMPFTWQCRPCLYSSPFKCP